VGTAVDDSKHIFIFECFQYLCKSDSRS